jgi:hypothetical protein
MDESRAVDGTPDRKARKEAATMPVEQQLSAVRRWLAALTVATIALCAPLFSALSRLGFRRLVHCLQSILKTLFPTFYIACGVHSPDDTPGEHEKSHQTII